MPIKVGDWDKLRNALDVAKLKPVIEQAGARATRQAGLFTVRKIKKRMLKVSSPPNAQITVDRKKSSKPLIGIEGDLFNAITFIPISPLSGFVGVPGKARRKDNNVSLALIARVLEGGDIGKRPKDTIITHKNAKALFIPLKKDVQPGDSGLVRGEDFVLAASVRIKSRPFIGPGIKDAQKGTLKIYEKFIRNAYRKLLS
jgi:hypothetical protein